MTDEELNQLATELWKRMEPFAKVELERLFTNYMSTRTLLEPELVKHLFDAMKGDLQKFVQGQFNTLQITELKRRAEIEQQMRRWQEAMKRGPY